MTKHEFVWDGRGERGEDARLSVISGRAATDLRFTCVHFRVLAHLGRFNHKKGWCRISQKGLGELLSISRRSINKAIGQLVEWGYIEEKTQEESGESFCHYRTILDQGEVRSELPTPPEGVRSQLPTSEKPRDTRVGTRKDTLDHHIDHVEDRSFENGSDDRKRRPAVLHRFVSEAALDRVRDIAPGWDRQALLRKFTDWPGSKSARDMDAAFLGWVPKFTKGAAPS
jgi:biotin operon repressor